MRDPLRMVKSMGKEFIDMQTDFDTKEIILKEREKEKE
jgi:hypothetical protein